MKKILQIFSGRQDLFLIALIMSIILVMIIPLPTVLIDVLIAMNLTLTIMVLIVAVYLKRPEEFSSFPAIILIATTFRLAVTISTTRLILSQADAGAIIDTFGHFVTRGSLLVGLVIFLVITTVQFLVITKGSERVAEVAARFNLDGMPGRQMSIDAEMRNGDITAAEAQIKRAQLEKENQFFGAMDGAMKFVKGDAIAGLIIVAINLIGGLSVGMLVKGDDVQTALQVYSRLTVGDGLIAQIPALIIAMCAGTIITRVNSGKNADLGTDIVSQLASSPRALATAAVLIAGLGFIPGFPIPVFLVISALLGSAAWFMSRNQAEAGAEAFQTAAAGASAARRRMMQTQTGAGSLPGVPAEVNIEAHEGDVVVIALGQDAYGAIDRYSFAAMCDEQLDILQAQMGLAFRPFGIQQDPALGPNDIRILLDGVAGFSGSVPNGVMVAVCDPDVLALNGFEHVRLDASWPLRSAYWVSPTARQVLESVNAEILTATALIVRTAAIYLRRNAHRILDYQHVQQIIKELGAEHEQLAMQISQSISAVQLLNVMRRLLMEGVPLAPRRLLFEALLEASVTGGSAAHLASMARTTMSRQICASHADQGRVIAGYVLEPGLELELRNSLVKEGADEFGLNLRPDVSSALLAEANANLRGAALSASPPVILTSEELRWPLSKFLRVHSIDVSVLAFHEVTSEFLFTPIGALGATMMGQPMPQDQEMAA